MQRRAATSRRGGSLSPTIRWPRSTAGSATTRARPPATGPAWTAPCRSTRSSGSSAISPSSAAGRSTARRPAPGRRVLVIGAGPSGLSAAYHLARRGHEVEVRDAGARPGGMMRYGIPAYRLPRDVLDAELDRIDGARRAGSPRGTGSTDLAAERAEGGFDAVFVAVGAHLSKRVEIPATRRRADRGRPVVPAQRRRGRAAGDRPPGGRLRRRQHRDGRGPDGPAARRGRRR